MVIVNGNIQVIGKSGGGMVGGKPVPVQTAFDDPIPCNFRANSYEKRGFYVDGVFTQAAYIILIEAQPFEACTFLLKDLRGKKIGTFTVHEKGIQYLDAVDNIQIIV